MSEHATSTGHPKAVVFDLLTALLDSWTLWNTVAGDPSDGLRWRRHYLRLTYGAGPYRPYEEIVADAAREADLPLRLAGDLVERWDELEPWPEVPEILGQLAGRHRLAVVTNCSHDLAERAVSRLGAAVDVLVSAEQAGFYKPRPEPYVQALARLGVPSDQAVFVAGSANDIPGAGGVGMPVIWHNRAGLPRVSADEPMATISTLHPLPGLIAG